MLDSQAEPDDPNSLRFRRVGLLLICACKPQPPAAEFPHESNRGAEVQGVARAERKEPHEPGPELEEIFALTGHGESCNKHRTRDDEAM